MNKASVIRILALSGLLMSVLMLLPALAALLMGEIQQLYAFIVTAIATGVLSGSVYILIPKPSRKATPADALAVAIVWWFLAPVAAAPPFILGVANANIGAALQEAISCLTTTGYSVIKIGDSGWPASLILWRGVLHVLGAIASIVMATSVFAAMNLGGPGVHRTKLFTIPKTSFFTIIPKVSITVTWIVLFLILLIFTLLLMAGTPAAIAATDAVSVITTGLVDPSGDAEFRISIMQRTIRAVGLIAGSVGLAIWLALRSGQSLHALTDPEFLTFLGCLVGFTFIAFLDGTVLIDGLAWSLSAISTSGLALTSTDVQAGLPASLIVIPALIGGSALSAAGGFKLGRFFILIRRAMLEFARLGFRGSMVSLKFRGRVQPENTVIGIWVYFIAYLLAITLIMTLLSFSLMEFRPILLTAVGALSNSGMLIDASLTTGWHGAVLMFSMILGRLEVLALVPAFMPGFWRR